MNSRQSRENARAESRRAGKRGARTAAAVTEENERFVRPAILRGCRAAAKVTELGITTARAEVIRQGAASKGGGGGDDTVSGRVAHDL